ncbi:MAG: hypothetical protein AB7W37_06315 [Syntrophobacteraceae bacterium]
MMHPVNSQTARGGSDSKRNLFCAHYDRCLDVAVENNWRGFSCAECQGFLELQWDWDDWLRDAIACTKLMAAIFETGPDDAASPREKTFGERRRVAQSRSGRRPLTARGETAAPFEAASAPMNRTLP